MKYNLIKIQLNFKSIITFVICMTVALLVNCFGSVFATRISFPLYLDSILTIGITALFGLIPGVLCAALSNGILYFFDYTMLPFMSCHILTAIFAWLVFLTFDKKTNFENKQYYIECFLWAGLWSAISNAILGNLIADSLFGANVNRENTEATIQGVYVVTHNLLFSTYLAGTLTNLVDKMISAVLSYAMYLIARKK